MDTGVIILNLVAYGSLAAGLVQRQSPKQIEELGVFPLLESTFRRAFPDLPSGFTWREGIALAKGLGFELHWNEVDEAIASYEAYRYGGSPMSDPSPPELIRLAEMLERYR